MGTSANRPGPRMRREQEIVARMRGTQDRVADAITAFSGTMLFVYLHVLWFTVWIVCNEGCSATAPSGIRTPSDCSP